MKEEQCWKRMESVKALTWEVGVCLEAEEGDSQYDEAGRQRDQQAKAVLTRSRIQLLFSQER